MRLRMIRAVVALGFALASSWASPLAAQPSAGLPLTDVLALARPYPNLLFEVRAELVRAGLRKEDIVCSGRGFTTDWPQLRAARRAPYACRIGRRTLVVTARQTYLDANGHRLAAEDAATMKRAVRVVEAGLAWRWR